MRLISDYIDRIGKRCCGCSACSQICPRSCIEMKADAEGFLYPIVDKAKCVNCGLCESVCPITRPIQVNRPLLTIGAKAKFDQIRSESSSGGIFPIIAHTVLSCGGVVFGVRYDDQWQAVFDYTDNEAGLKLFQGSKYVQASVGDSYNQVRSFLQSGRMVLFSGVECQVAGLKKFLVKDYDNLLTISCACHGAPSPMVWTKALSEFGNPQSIIEVTFRNKKNGTDCKNFLLRRVNAPDISKPSIEIPFYRAFVYSLIERPCCRKCISKNGTCSDIQLADLWTANRCCPQLSDQNGVSFVSINSSKGKKYLPLDQIDYAQVSIEDAKPYNAGLANDRHFHPRRNEFFKELITNPSKSVSLLIEEKLKKKWYELLFERIKGIEETIEYIIKVKVCHIL